jgi:hypothetical protein
MARVFITYSSKDSELARQLHATLQCAGAQPFLAELDIKSGEDWRDTILKNIRQSQWVFFLATSSSCASYAVAHEIGATLVLEKKLIPLMWGVTPEQLPEWVSRSHAMDLRDSGRIARLVEEIGETVKSDRFWTGVAA